MYKAIIITLLLAGCDGSKVSYSQASAISRSCLDAGMMPHVHYYAYSNDITKVTCEPK
jgi:hypothetical protein